MGKRMDRGDRGTLAFVPVARAQVRRQRCNAAMDPGGGQSP